MEIKNMSSKGFFQGSLKIGISAPLLETKNTKSIKSLIRENSRIKEENKVNAKRSNSLTLKEN